MGLVQDRGPWIDARGGVCTHAAAAAACEGVRPLGRPSRGGVAGAWQEAKGQAGDLAVGPRRGSGSCWVVGFRLVGNLVINITRLSKL